MTNEIDQSPHNSDESCDEKVELYRRAEKFIENAREQRNIRKQNLRGRNRISTAVVQSIANTASRSGLISNLTTLADAKIDVAAKQAKRKAVKPISLKILEKDANYLFERFEEMCRRLNITVPDDIRPAMLNILSGELAVNKAIYEANGKDVIPATIYHGSLADLLKEEKFAIYQDTPFIFKYAVSYFPINPRAFLEELSANLKTCAQDDGFDSMTRAEQIRYAANKIGSENAAGEGIAVHEASEQNAR